MSIKPKFKIAYLANLDRNLYIFRLDWIDTLISKGHDVYAIVPDGKYCSKLRNKGVKVINFTTNRRIFVSGLDLKTAYQLYRIFKKEKFDILHTFTLKSNVYGFLGKLAGIPIIISHITGLGYLFIDNTLFIRLCRVLMKFLLRIVFGVSRYVIFQNQDDYTVLKKIVNQNKVKILKGSGVDANYYSLGNVNLADSSIMKSKFFIDKSNIVVTFVSRLLWHKGIREMVEAANILTGKYGNVTFLIVGCSDKGNPTAPENDFIEKSSVNKKIFFLGWQEEIRDILSITDIFVLPSYREGLPRSGLEAMAMSKPIITTNVPGCKEIVNSGVNGFLVPAKDTHALAQAIEILILNKDLRLSMGNEGRKFVIQDFCNEVIITKILKLYGIS